jgi:hypothetical protein
MLSLATTKKGESACSLSNCKSIETATAKMITLMIRWRFGNTGVPVADGNCGKAGGGGGDCEPSLFLSLS